MFPNATIDGFKKRRAEKAQKEAEYKAKQEEIAAKKAAMTEEEKKAEASKTKEMINFLMSNVALQQDETAAKIEENRKRNGGW